MATLPELTEEIDTNFVSTWYEIRAEAIDNILDATPVTAALKAAGCFVTQTGGRFITRTIRYGTEEAEAVEKNSILPQGEPELKTMAMWKWRYIASHAQRSLFDDQQNSGKLQIANLVEDRLTAARDALVKKYETRFLATGITAETGIEIQSLWDVLPTYSNRATGSFGEIVRSNSWWQAKYLQLTAPYAVNLTDDMRNLYNTVSANQEPPNLLLTDQTLFELYEGFALNIAQIVKDTGSQLADLGFEVLRFKGKPLIWSSAMTSNNMMMLNTNYIEVVYDPNLWFDMTNFKDIPLQGSRIAHILCAINVIGTQPRRQGLLYA